MVNDVGVSARNRFEGQVTGVRGGAVNVEVGVALAGGLVLVATVTRDSVLALGLQPRQAVQALVKSSAVVLMAGDGTGVSARNRLPGVVTRILAGALTATVELEPAPGLRVAANLGGEALARLGLAVGDPATALIEPSQVMLGVTPPPG